MTEMPMPNLDTLPLRKNGDVLCEILELKGKQIADVGCGDGGLVRLMTKAGARVSGIECSDAQLEKARESAPAGDETYMHGFGENMPLADASQDTVVFFNSLHHVPVDSQAQAIEEAARVLKPGGTLYIAEPVAAGSNFELGKLIDDETEIRAHAYGVLKNAGEAGFRETDEFSYMVELRQTDFETYRERAIRINPARKPMFESHGEEMRARFEQFGRPHPEGGYAFSQPIRINILVKN